MPFERLPGAHLDLSPLQYHPYYAPARPVFPTAAVVMDALNKLLPALDPVERGKRQMALAEMKLAPQKLALEKRQLDMGMTQADLEQKWMEEAKSGKTGAAYDWVNGKIVPMSRLKQDQMANAEQNLASKRNAQAPIEQTKEAVNQYRAKAQALMQGQGNNSPQWHAPMPLPDTTSSEDVNPDSYWYQQHQLGTEIQPGSPV